MRKEDSQCRKFEAEQREYRRRIMDKNVSLFEKIDGYNSGAPFEVTIDKEMVLRKLMHEAKL